MIKSWEELGEYLGDVENRLSRIENSQHCHQEPAKEPEPEERWVSKQWDVVNQLRGGFLHLQEKVNKKYDKQDGF